VITGRTARVSTGVQARHGGRVAGLAPAISGDGRFVAFTAVERIERRGAVDTAPLGVFLHDRRRVATTRLGGPDALDAGPPSLSDDGRFVAFSTRARLAPGDRNRLRDAYVLDRRTGRAALASIGVRGRPANRPVDDPVLSADGRVVAFESEATTLARGVRGRAYHVFVHDLRTRRTTLASVLPDGRPPEGNATAPALSGDGRRVAFQLSPRSGPIGDVDGPIGRVFVRDLARNTTWPATTTPSGRSGFPALSADGRLLAFVSADPLLPGDDNGMMDVYTCGPLD
jgi:Tol biopolymer transport system component